MAPLLAAASLMLLSTACAESAFRNRIGQASEPLDAFNVPQSDIEMSIRNAPNNAVVSSMSMIPQATSYDYAGINYFYDSSCTSLYFGDGFYTNACRYSMDSTIFNALYSFPSVMQSATSGNVTVIYSRSPACIVSNPLPRLTYFAQSNKACTASSLGSKQVYSQFYVGSSIPYGTSRIIQYR